METLQMCLGMEVTFWSSLEKSRTLKESMVSGGTVLEVTLLWIMYALKVCYVIVHKVPIYMYIHVQPIISDLRVHACMDDRHQSNN